MWCSRTPFISDRIGIQFQCWIMLLCRFVVSYICPQVITSIGQTLLLKWLHWNSFVRGDCFWTTKPPLITSIQALHPKASAKCNKDLTLSECGFSKGWNAQIGICWRLQTAAGCIMHADCSITQGQAEFPDPAPGRDAAANFKLGGFARYIKLVETRMDVFVCIKIQNARESVTMAFVQWASVNELVTLIWLFRGFFFFLGMVGPRPNSFCLFLPNHVGLNCQNVSFGVKVSQVELWIGQMQSFASRDDVG